jgi:hypothetical protein
MTAPEKPGYDPHSSTAAKPEQEDEQLNIVYSLLIPAADQQDLHSCPWSRLPILQCRP